MTSSALEEFRHLACRVMGIACFSLISNISCNKSDVENDCSKSFTLAKKSDRSKERTFIRQVLAMNHGCWGHLCIITEMQSMFIIKKNLTGLGKRVNM